MASSTLTLGESPNPAASASASVGAISKALELEKAVLEFTDRLYDSAVENDPEFQSDTKETLNMIEYVFGGKHWREGQRFSRNRPSLPKAARHFWESVGMLTDLALDFQIKSFQNFSGAPDEFEKLLNELATHWALKSHFEDRTYDCVFYGLLNTGPSKLQWNSSLQGGMGDIQLVPIAPWQIAYLGCGADPQESECIIYFTPVTKDQLIRRFGPTANRVECDADFSGTLTGGFNRPAGISKSSWATMGTMLKKRMGVKTTGGGSEDPYPKALLKEFWMNDDSVNEGSVTVTVGPADSSGEPLVNWAYRVEPGEKLYPRGRVICTAGGAVLEDQCNPYWHAKKPFPVYRPLRVPYKISGDSSVKRWIALNTIVNKIVGGELDALYSINEPTLVGPKGALPKADWDALDPGAAGGKIATNNNAPGKLEFAKKATFPFSESNQLVEQLSKEMDASSTASAMQQALNKKQVPGGDSLEMIISSRSLPIRVQTRSLTSFIEDIGTMGVANMLQFYTAAHRVAILGEKGLSASDFRPIYAGLYNSSSGMKPEEFVRKYQGIIKKDSTLASQKTDKQQIAIVLQKQGVISKRELMRRLDNEFNWDRNEQELIHEAKIQIALAGVAAAATGKGHKK